MRTTVLIASLAALLVGSCLLAGCPAAEEDPGQGVHKTIEQLQQFVRSGEYDKVWPLYSIEYREKIQGLLAVQKQGIRESVAHQRYDVDKWALAQSGMTAAQYLKASAREIDAAVLEVRRKYVLEARVVGDVSVEGDLAYARLHIPPGDPSDATFVFRNGRWLIHDQSYESAK